LNAEEIKNDCLQELPSNSEYALVIENGSFIWKTKLEEKNKDIKIQEEVDLKELKGEEKQDADESLLSIGESRNLNFLDKKTDEFVLRNVNLSIKKGEKVVIFGDSTSGKSSLLYCCLGEMIPEHNEIKVKKCGKMCLMDQGRWLIGDTVKENITLGKPYDESEMEEALRASELLPDLGTFSHGLETGLGDTTDTVSGGQRARIALARCFYQK
jgi:ABC-type transport system involved in cytochrome bd biosynthesis fused ATPase/permease subunit